MNVHIATKTLKAFDECLRRDQGAAFRVNSGKVFPCIADAYRGEDEGFRSHLGASMIGRECARELWYQFHWTTKPKFSGQIIRLFNRGHLEEARFIALMLTIGCQVYQQDAEGKQYRISDHGGHFGGSGDGVIIGLPDVVAGMPVLTEYKTHGDKSFIKLAGSDWKRFHEGLLDSNKPQIPFSGEGVREAKFEHWVQMQVYMRKMGIAVALYCAVNKNDDHIYAELVPLDSASADSFISRAGEIIKNPVSPPMINKAAGWYGCNFCDQKPVCKLGKEPERNCRTCHYSDPNVNDGKWYCTNLLRSGELSKERQLQGCDLYTKNPSM